jgi:hypothetical protein
MKECGTCRWWDEFDKEWMGARWGDCKFRFTVDIRWPASVEIEFWEMAAHHGKDCPQWEMKRGSGK